MANFGPLAAEIVSLVWGTPAKCQRVSRLAFVTAATSLTKRPTKLCTMFGRLLAGTLYIHFRGLLLYVQVLRSPILAALLHDTPAAVTVSQTLRRGTRNGITELSQKTPSIFGRAAITLGIGPHSSYGRPM